MPGHIYIAAMNPAAAFALAAFFAFLSRRLPSETYLFPLWIAFLYLGLGFIVHDFRLLTPPGGVNYAGNGLIMLAVALACTSALMRARAKVPFLAFGAVLATAVAVFMWSSWAEPSITGRIIAASIGFTGLTLVTFVQLLRTGVPTLSDRLITTGVGIGIIVTLTRPILVLQGTLSINPNGDFRDSTYWETVRAFSPIMAGAIAALFLFSVISDLLARLRAEADTDSLTGLLNRRGFEKASASALADAAPTNSRPGLLLADIDDFKKINDAFGHAVGDRVIRAVAQALKDQGGAQTSSRIGGEEFALFYTGIDRGALRERARDIQAELSQIATTGLPQDYPLTVSMGLHIGDGTESWRDMFLGADKALYRAKHEGKNRAVLSPARLGVVGENQIDPGHSLSA
jgi:diguanylate cyclase (GGDEF)-like protein